MLNRAYSVLDVKSIDADQRIIRGIATTPTPDRVGDIIEPFGAKFSNPLPLLLFHDSTKPVGLVTFKTPTRKGIEFEAHIPEITEPGTLQDRVNEAWQSAKAGLLRGASIGFRAIADKVESIKSGGLRFIESEIVELSMVVIPMNAEAVIHTIKALDSPHLAASGMGVADPVIPAGVTALPGAKAPPKARRMATPTFTEQIKEYADMRGADDARMKTLMQIARDDGNRVLTEPEEEEYDDLAAQVEKYDKHLVRLRAQEKSNQEAAVPVNGKTPAEASESRGSVIRVNSTLPKGTAFTRYAMALAAGRGSRLEAAEYARRWERDTPEVAMVLKAAVTAGTTTDSDWAAPLVVYNNLANEFIELLRPQTILGKIPGIRRVPFNVTMPTQTQGASANWVGQTKPKPVSELKFGQLSLGMFKAAGIVVLSEELVRSSSPSAEAIVRQDLIATIAQFLDEQFINPENAGVANVSPAAITNGITPVDSTGTTAAAFRTDFKTLMATFTAANLSLSGAVWVMTETQALAFSMVQNALGQAEYPGIMASGGTFMGLPVVTSESVAAEGGSPAGNRIVLIKASEILLADDGGVTVDVSREASVQMNSTPDDPATASTVMVSFWQNNLVGLRAERYINWVRRRAEAVGIIEGAIYVG